MKNNLLFVNQSQEIIQEFLEAMSGEELEIDTTDNGRKAVALLRTKKYKVVVTGMDLTPFDGAKLIAHLNQYFPKSVCIIYTRRLELAHLKLLVNERNVFRIFQKPADLKGEVRQALMAAFEYFDLHDAQQQEKLDLERKLRLGRLEMAELARTALSKKGKAELAVFLQTILKAYAGNIKITLSTKEKQMLFWYETEFLSRLLENEFCDLNSLETIKQKLERMCTKAEWNHLAVVVDRIEQSL